MHEPEEDVDDPSGHENEEVHAAERARAARANARRIANEKFALVFWLEEPRSADVVPKTSVLPDERFPCILPMQQRKVMWGDRAYDARIMRTGLKGDLIKVKVSRDGEVLVDAGPDTLVVTTRKKAVATLESRARVARRDAQDELDQLVLVAAVGAPLPRPDRNADDAAEVNEALKHLPCLQKPPEGEERNFIQLGPKVYADKQEVHLIYRIHKKKPVKMFRALLVLLLTQELVDRRCISVSGRYRTAKVPPDVLKAAISYTSLNSKGKDFDVTKTVANLLLKKK